MLLALIGTILALLLGEESRFGDVAITWQARSALLVSSALLGLLGGWSCRLVRRRFSGLLGNVIGYVCLAAPAFLVTSAVLMPPSTKGFSPAFRATLSALLAYVAVRSLADWGNPNVRELQRARDEHEALKEPRD